MLQQMAIIISRQQQKYYCQSFLYLHNNNVTGKRIILSDIMIAGNVDIIPG